MADTREATTRPRVLVTGGARRVGASICRAFAAAGCDVTLTYNTRESQAQAVVQELAKLGSKAEARSLQLLDLESFPRFFEQYCEKHERLDVLIHNASMYAPCALEDVTSEQALEQFSINALAPLLLTREFAPLLARSGLAGGGSIVAMGDIHAMGRPRVGFAPYSMSKAALLEMVRTLARELAPRIRVNAVSPGVVAFPDEGFESDEEAQRLYLSRVPLGRAGTPQDAADAVRWLALDAHYVTGQILRVDGGRWLS